MKGMFLFLDSDFLGQIIQGEIIDGKVLIKRGKEMQEFILSIPTEVDGKVKWQDVNPIKLVKGRLGGVKPFYILKWNSLYPVAFEIRDTTKNFINPETHEQIVMQGKTLEVVVPEFKDTKILPEMLGETHDMRFLKQMKKYQTGGGMEMKGILTFALIGIILASAGYLIYHFFFQKQGG